MLSASEITDLEKRVFAYRLKSQLRYVFLFLLSITCFAGLFFGYTYSNKKTIPPLPTVEQNTSDDQNIASRTEVNASFSLPVKEEIPIISPIVEEVVTTLMLRSPSVNTGSELKKNPSSVEVPGAEFIKQEPLRQSDEVLAPPATKEFYRSTDDSIDTTVLAPPHLDEVKPKGMIKIESKEVNSIEYLKSKFEKTSNIIFALMLAEEYYTNKNYTESNKWALIANHIDAENEKSWLWFAKSKVKLGQKEDAVVALKAFLKTNKSQAVQTLLNKINLGEVNE